MSNPLVYHAQSSSRGQAGAATLTMAAILLLAMTLLVLYTHKSLVFEQRAAANQKRAVQAATLAEAGLQWALAALNTPDHLAASPLCTYESTGGGVGNFRDRYLAPSSPRGSTPAGFFPPSNTFAGCSLSDGGQLVCACPAQGSPLEISPQDEGSFYVQFAVATGAPHSVEVVSTGCAAARVPCSPGQTGAEGTAEVRQMLRLVGPLASPTGAALSVGGDIASTGPLQVFNNDDISGGVTLRSGGSISIGSNAMLNGTSATSTHSSLRESDLTLAQLRASPDASTRVIELLLGRGVERYRNDPMTLQLSSASCATALACGKQLHLGWLRGYQQFWSASDVTLDASQLSASAQIGTADRPVFIVGQGRLELAGNLALHGLIYAEYLQLSGATGTVELTGAAVVLHHVTQNNQGLQLTYDPKALGMAGGPPVGLLAPVPGSWRDRRAAY